MGKNCNIRDPLRNTSIDLNPLRNSADFTLPLESHPNDTIRFNLCTSLKKPCAGVKDTSMCLNYNGTEYSIGGVALFPKYNEAMVKFDLYGNPCEQGRHFTKVTIMVSCDREAEQPGVMQFIAGQACHFYVVWHSKVVCPPFEEGLKCNVQNGETGDWFDLSPLNDYVHNIKAAIHTTNGTVVADLFLNVCRSPVFGHHAPCPLHSEICMHLKDPNDQRQIKIVSLGEIGDTGPVILTENDVPKIHFRNGDVCDNSRNIRFTSAITFPCDSAANRKPVYELGKSSQCHIEITWPTPQACPNKIHPKERVNGCQAVNPKTNHSFNLSKLKNKLWMMSGSVQNSDKQNRYQYYISVCSPLPRGENFRYCGYGAAGCMGIGQAGYSLGHFSEDLVFLNHRLTLTYVNGRYCEGNEMYNAEVSFLCTNKYFPRNGPQFVEQLGCKFIFVFYTDLACEKKSLTCTVDTTIYGEGVDIPLISLMQPTVPYRVEGPDGHVFLLNVCGSLPTALNTDCKRSSAACLVKSDNKFSSTPKSLGFPHSRPVLDHLPGDKKPQVVWKYTGGDRCSGHSNVNRSANIRFICDPNVGPGRPKYEGRSEDFCVYNFSWNTSVVCIEEKVILNRTSCTLTNRATRDTYNLIDLYPSEIRKEMMTGSRPSPTGENLYIYLCFWPQHWMNVSSTVECKDTAVCAHGGDGSGDYKGYGFQPFPYYDSTNNTIKIFFRGTYRDACSYQEVSGAEIWFPCATDGRVHKPKLLAATECHVVIEWPSRMFCPPGFVFPTAPSGFRTAWKTIAAILGFAAIASAVLYVARKTDCWSVVTGRVNRAMGYNRSPIVTYTVDPQEEWAEFEALNNE